MLLFLFFVSLFSNEFVLPQVYSSYFWKGFLINWKRNLLMIGTFSAGEEIFWRILPLTFVVWLKEKIKKEKIGDLLLLGVIFLSSFGFALSHSNRFNIFLQGVFGLIWSFVFLKTGGYNKYYFKASLSVIFSYLLYNFLVLSNGYLFVKWLSFAK